MSDIVSLADFSRLVDIRGPGARHANSGPTAGRPAKSPPPQSTPPKFPPPFFDRRELDLILGLYAVMVAAGEWRDYAIGQDGESCSFDIFPRACDVPLYRIVKTPKLARRQGAYSIVAAGGRVLRRGASLAAALRLFDRERFQIV